MSFDDVLLSAALTRLETALVPGSSCRLVRGTELHRRNRSIWVPTDLDHSTVSPFAPSSVESCEVKPGTKIFVVGSSVECSSFEGNGTTDEELRQCARQGDVQRAPDLTVDGESVTLSEAETPLLNLVLPADNIFGLPAGTPGQSVGHGWVTLLNPLTPGTHTIVIGGTITTEIVVTPGL
jgi:hypothetical protein